MGKSRSSTAKLRQHVGESKGQPASSPSAAPQPVAAPGSPPAVEIRAIFFYPPNAVARLGASATPFESYTWAEDPTIAGRAQTVIEPAISFDVIEDGTIRPYLPSVIRFRDGTYVRPVAPFLELWARVNENGQESERQVTVHLLERANASMANLTFRATAANKKAERRCNEPACGFGAQVIAIGTDHSRKPLLAISPNRPNSQPLVLFDRPIPLGTFQVIRPFHRKDGNDVLEMNVNLSAVRVRFTPAAGEVYGPPTATVGQAPGTNRSHTIVKPENQILNPQALWAHYDANSQQFRNPQPSDTYDGADTDQEQSWGVVDDTCDVLVECDLVIGGVRRQAQARIAVSPPHFAPDRRPFVSLADELKDRDEPSARASTSHPEAETQAELELRINDLFQRALEVAGLFNVDANRARAIATNGGADQVAGTPRTDNGMMTNRDVPYADLSDNALPASVPHARLPRTDLVAEAHGPLADLNSMVTKLREQADRIRLVVRPPYGRFREFSTLPADKPNDRFRDPRIDRDTQYDMRMPPFMRDSDASAMSITHSQYDELMHLVDLLEAKQKSFARTIAAATDLKANVAPPIHVDTPIRRRVTEFIHSQETVKAQAARPTTAKPPPPRATKGKIFPRNLTARADYAVVGNPESSRLESGVGNCFPGLEFDHRNLDRRFLPGLVVEFVSGDDSPDAAVQLRGARLVDLNSGDPGLSPAPGASQEERSALTALRQQIADLNIDPTAESWFISAIIQKGVHIDMAGPNSAGRRLPFDGLTVWRLVRCLEPGPVDAELTPRAMPNNAPLPDPITLNGWRRRYTDPATGVLSASYQPGELTQSLCSPWTHDFRDCGCFYWASNHPDVVHVEDLPGDPTLPGGQSEDPNRAVTRVRWLRSDRAPERSSEARESYGLNRPTEMDHYEINLRWQELPMVIGDKELTTLFRPREIDKAQPFESADEMAASLFDLATLEHVLILEYLYAYFSIRTPDEIPAGPSAEFLKQDVQFMRHFIQLVAVSEMQHLRWANQLLWELREGGFLTPGTFTKPSLGVSLTVPVNDAGVERPRALRTLELATLNDFIAVERPSGQIEGAYARVVATLRTDSKYPPSLFQLASRIANDGQEHFQRFRDIQAVMGQYLPTTPWLRQIAPGDPGTAAVKAALKDYAAIVDNLTAAYQTGSVTDRFHITAARQAMADLDTHADALAKKGIGVPFFE